MTAARHERHFDDDPVSIGAARRFVAEALEDDPALAGDLQLVVSELATNAVLHAGSQFRVSVDRSPDSVRLAVFDASPHEPVPRDYGTDAVTGRGLRIVEQLVDRWGVTQVEDGKWVWAEVGPVGDSSDDTDGSAAPGSTRSTVEVVLKGLPVELHRRSEVHLAALQREFDVLSAEADPAVDHGPPRRLVELIAELAERYGPLTDRPRSELSAAIADGAPTVDLVYDVPPEVGGIAERVGQILDEADRYCRSGEHLVTLATPPDLAAYRHWVLREFARQTSGGEPIRWNADDALAGPRPPGGGDHVDPVHAASSGRRVVRPVGVIDLSTSPDLRRELHRSDASSVVLDLHEVTFIDSVGLSVLISAHQRMEESGVTLEVLAPEHLRPLFEMTGLDQFLDTTFS